MDCTIACECGRSIDVAETDRRAECPGCGAIYAVTITQISKPAS